DRDTACRPLRPYIGLSSIPVRARPPSSRCGVGILLAHMRARRRNRRPLPAPSASWIAPNARSRLAGADRRPALDKQRNAAHSEVVSALAKNRADRHWSGAL